MQAAEKMAYCPASSIGRAAICADAARGNGWTCAFRRFVVLLRVPKTGHHFPGLRVESTGLGVGKAGHRKCAARANTLCSGLVALTIIDCWSVHKLLGCGTGLRHAFDR